MPVFMADKIVCKQATVFSEGWVKLINHPLPIELVVFIQDSIDEPLFLQLQISQLFTVSLGVI
jgi:hypothetical protein